MPADRVPAPPRLAVILLRARIPRELAEAITGDLEEEYRTRVLPTYGPLGAALWFWGQALTVRGGALRRATRGPRSTRPTWERNRPNRVGAGDPKVVFGELISWDYFQVVGVPMALGRSFLPEEGATQGSHAVMILGYRTWTQGFGAREDVVGETVRLNGRSFTVVGVAPKAFKGSLPVLVSPCMCP